MKYKRIRLWKETIEFGKHTEAHKYNFLFVICISLFRQGLVDSVVLFTLLYLVVTDILFPVGWNWGLVKNGCFKTSSAEILLTGDSWNSLCSRSTKSGEILSTIYSSIFLKRYERISSSDKPVFSFIRSLQDYISFSSVFVGTPIKYRMTLLRLFVSFTSNIYCFLFRYLKISFRKITPADQISILES